MTVAAQSLHKKLPFQEKPHPNSPAIWVPELSPSTHQVQPLAAPKSLFVRKQSIIPFFDISDDKVQEQISTVPVPKGPKQAGNHCTPIATTQNCPKASISCRKGNLEPENGDATSTIPPVSPWGKSVCPRVPKSWFSSQKPVKQVILLFHVHRDIHTSSLYLFPSLEIF